MKLKVDSRNKRWSVAKHFGQVAIEQFPLEFSVKESFSDYIQPIGDVRCTAITCCDVAGDKDGVQYDIDDLFNRIPHDNNGAVPQDALKETVKGGLLPIGQTQRIKPFSSFYEPHSGQYDYFDNVRSSLLTMQKVNGKAYPVIVYTNWYMEWINKLILPIGINPISGHMYNIDGWKIVNGETHLTVSAWLTYQPTISRDAFNKAVSSWGCGTAILSTVNLDIDRKKTIIETITDWFKNIILSFRKPLTPENIQDIIDTQTKIDKMMIENNIDKTTPLVPNLSKKLYDLSYSLIGKRLFITDVGGTYGCGQALSYVLKQFGLSIPKQGISGTVEMDKWLQKNCTQVDKPNVGDIIISITEGDNHGHCGIVGKNAIMSNDSQTGKWQPYWSMDAWNRYYTLQKGLITKYYKV